MDNNAFEVLKLSEIWGHNIYILTRKTLNRYGVPRFQKAVWPNDIELHGHLKPY